MDPLLCLWNFSHWLQQGVYTPSPGAAVTNRQKPGLQIALNSLTALEARNTELVLLVRNKGLSWVNLPPLTSSKTLGVSFPATRWLPACLGLCFFAFSLVVIVQTAARCGTAVVKANSSLTEVHPLWGSSGCTLSNSVREPCNSPHSLALALIALEPSIV